MQVLPPLDQHAVRAEYQAAAAEVVALARRAAGAAGGLGGEDDGAAAAAAAAGGGASAMEVDGGQAEQREEEGGEVPEALRGLPRCVVAGGGVAIRMWLDTLAGPERSYRVTASDASRRRAPKVCSLAWRRR